MSKYVGSLELWEVDERLQGESLSGRKDCGPKVPRQRIRLGRASKGVWLWARRGVQLLIRLGPTRVFGTRGSFWSSVRELRIRWRYYLARSSS
jgi:hypothetical protein